MKIIEWLEKRVNLTEIVSFIGSFGIFYIPLDTKKPLKEALKEYNDKPIPAYTRFPQILGIITFFLFVLSLITGILLLLYYKPAGEQAFHSVKQITRDVALGFYVRELHRWSGIFLIIFLFFRLVRFTYDAVFQSPRELLWIIGVSLLYTAIFQSITGNLLPWSQRAYWSTVRALETIGSIPVVGNIFFFLVGGKEISGITLTRFFALHIIVYPTIFFLLFYLHFNVIRKTGLTVRREKGEFIKFYPDYFLEIIIILLVLFGILLTVSVFFPAKDYEIAKLFTTPPGIHPPWYLLPIYGLMEITSPLIGGIAVFIFSIFLFFVPFVIRVRRLFILRSILLIFLILIVLLALKGYFTEIAFAR
jgi:quinol-cytochrome oxidoreductase complex cytochrome b subunit